MHITEAKRLAVRAILHVERAGLEADHRARIVERLTLAVAELSELDHTRADQCPDCRTTAMISQRRGDGALWCERCGAYFNTPESDDAYLRGHADGMKMAATMSPEQLSRLRDTQMTAMSWNETKELLQRETPDCRRCRDCSGDDDDCASCGGCGRVPV